MQPDRRAPSLRLGCTSNAAMTVFCLLLGASSPARAEPSSTLEGSWRVSALPGRTVTPTDWATVVFQEGRVSGRAFCNSFWGTYRRAGPALAVTLDGQTMLGCRLHDPANPFLEGSGTMAAEDAMLAALRRVNAFDTTGDHLRLITADGKVIALVHAPDEDREKSKR